MTTSRSPLSQLKSQADRMAQSLKAVERGEAIASDPAGKIAAARKRESVKFVVIMDDKALSVEMTWVTIKTYSEASLSAYLLKYMRDNRDKVH